MAEEQNDTHQDSQAEKASKLPAKFTTSLPDDGRNMSELSANIKNTLEECTEDLKKISGNVSEIKDQGGFKRFFSVGKNIGQMADHIENMANVQQKTLDLSVMLMGASGQMKADYDTILESIEELSENNGGDTGVLDYLIKIKSTVKGIQERDDLLESMITYTNDLRDSLAGFEENNERLTKEVKEVRQESDAFFENMNEAHFKLARSAEEIEERLGMHEEQKSGLHERMDEIEARYEKKIKGLEEEIVILKNDDKRLRSSNKRLRRITYATIAMFFAAVAAVVFYLGTLPESKGFTDEESGKPQTELPQDGTGS